MGSASSKKRRRHRADRSDSRGRRPGQSDKRERQAEARNKRETIRKRTRARKIFGRAAAAGVGVAIAILLFAQLVRVTGARPVPDAALRAASAAACGDIGSPESDPARTHLSPGQSFTYDREPATAGPHDPAPLPADPHVYLSLVPETKAVHNLEHAYVLIYYRDQGADLLPTPVVKQLTALANEQDKVIMAPSPDLSSGAALALAAWNKLWECPASVTPDQARAIALGFVQAYRGTGNAPEPQAP
jgi:uncharacterized protein DUF3105